MLEAVGSIGTNKYAEGYPGRRYYGGCRVVDETETIAIERAKELFGAEHANVQPHAGAQANMGAYLALLNLGDTVMGLRLDQGGHLTHGQRSTSPASTTTSCSTASTGVPQRIDMDEVRKLAVEHRPKLIVAGASAYPRHFDFAAFRAIADEVGALLMVDMAHIAGLVAAGVHPSPVPHADIVTSTTHKTLAGPRAGFILCSAELAQEGRLGRLPRHAGRPADAHHRREGGLLRSGRHRCFRDYQSQVVANAAALAETLHRRAARARLGRHRQPPHAGGPEGLRARRPAGRGPPRGLRHHRQPERGPL